jgi:hypothetical protein
MSITQAGASKTESQKLKVQSAIQKFSDKLKPLQVIPINNPNLRARIDRLKDNPLTTEWASFTQVSEVQASFMMHSALVLFYDQIWLGKTAEEKEECYPLKTTSYNHQMLSGDTLLPSILLQKMHLIDKPEELVAAILFDQKVSILFTY